MLKKVNGQVAYLPSKIKVKTRVKPEQTQLHKQESAGQWQVDIVPARVRDAGYQLIKIDDKVNIRQWTMRDSQILKGLVQVGFNKDQCQKVLLKPQAIINKAVRQMGYKNFSQFKMKHRTSLLAQLKKVAIAKALQTGNTALLKYLLDRQYYQVVDDSTDVQVNIVLDSQG